mgnify:CR=1 FL=1
MPLRLAATLAAGLPEESRSMLKLRGLQVSVQTQLEASIADSLLRLEWRLFGREGSTMPPSILADLMELPERDSGDVQSYDNPEEFEAALAALKGG